MKSFIDRLKSFLLHNKSAKQTIVKNTFWLTFGEVVSRVLRAAIVIVAARLLGPGDWGIFAYAINIAAMFTIVTDLGINAVLVKEAARSSEGYAKYLSTSFYIKLVLIFIGIALIILGGPLAITMPGAEALLPIVAFILVFDGLREFFFSTTRALERMEVEAGAKILTNFLIVALGLVFVVMVPTAGSLAWSYLLGSALGAIYTLYALRKYLGGMLHNFEKGLAWPIFSEAWPFAMVGLFGTIMTSTDIFLMGYWLPAEEVGLYSAANRLIQLLYMLPSVFATSIFPVLARTYKSDIGQFGVATRKGINLMLTASLPLMIGGFILARPLMHFLFGIEYVDGYQSLQILLLTMPVAYTGATIINGLYASDRQKMFIWMLGMGAVLNALLDIILIPKMGAEGSALATLFAQAISIIPGWIVLSRAGNIPALPRIQKALLASILMALVVIALAQMSINFPTIIILGAMVYLGSLYALKDDSANEAVSLLKKVSG